MSAYKIQKGYFRGVARFGRITILVDKKTGEVVFSAMGVCTLRDMVRTFQNLKK